MFTQSRSTRRKTSFLSWPEFREIAEVASFTSNKPLVNKNGFPFLVFTTHGGKEEFLNISKSVAPLVLGQEIVKGIFDPFTFSLIDGGWVMFIAEDSDRERVDASDL